MTRGVLTAANDAFWRTLHALVRGCQREQVDIAVVDHGLSEVNRQWLVENGVALLDCKHEYERDLAAIASGHRGHPKAPPEAWWKPLVCQSSPFDHTIWIDADAILLRGAAEMFAALEQGPWLTRDWWIKSDRVPSLYAALCKKIYGRLPPDFPECCWVNSGVFGFNRGDAWMDGWRKMCQRITGDSRLLAECRCRDQSALAAWLAGNPKDAPRYIEDSGWNYPANGMMSHEAMRRTIYRPGRDLLKAATIDHPEAKVVHWLGRPKPDPER